MIILWQQPIPIPIHTPLAGASHLLLEQHRCHCTFPMLVTPPLLTLIGLLCWKGAWSWDLPPSYQHFPLFCQLAHSNALAGKWFAQHSVKVISSIAAALADLQGINCILQLWMLRFCEALGFSHSMTTSILPQRWWTYILVVCLVLLFHNASNPKFFMRLQCVCWPAVFVPHCRSGGYGQDHSCQPLHRVALQANGLINWSSVSVWRNIF